MIISKFTKKSELPKGYYILSCHNYTSKKQDYLFNGKLAEYTVFNSAYDFAKNARKLSSLGGLYELKEISKENYKLYNI